jgi:hypothetical protein
MVAAPTDGIEVEDEARQRCRLRSVRLDTDFLERFGDAFPCRDPVEDLVDLGLGDLGTPAIP